MPSNLWEEGWSRDLKAHGHVQVQGLEFGGCGFAFEGSGALGFGPRVLVFWG